MTYKIETEQSEDTGVAIWMATKSKILLVEDDADTCYALSMLFELEGFDVISATDGQQAYIQALVESPDLIVTDINMPKVSGLELIRLLKEDGRLSSVPVIAMSAVEKQQLDRAAELGAIAVYQKPIEFDQFLSLIINILATRHRKARFGRSIS